MSLSINTIIATGLAAAQALSSTNLIGDISSEAHQSALQSDLSAAHGAAIAGAPIVVLGARLNPDCAPPEVLSSRLDRAAAFVRLHPTNRLVVTGGKTQSGCLTEAQSMETLLRARLVVNPIIRDDFSGSTVENATNVANMIPDRETVLITSQDHLPRATGNFGEAGIATRGVPAF